MKLIWKLGVKLWNLIKTTQRDGARNRLAQYLIIGLAILPSLSLAANWHVDGEVTSSGDGTSWASAFKTIQEAIDASATFDEVWVKQGTYVLSSRINVNKWVNLYGGFDGTKTVRIQRDWKANITAVRGFYIKRLYIIRGLYIRLDTVAMTIWYKMIH
ncbi:MAG: hypothetical protein ABFS56_31895 [Pseudomonadota bacterium]